MYRVTLENGKVVTYTKEQYEALDEATKSTFTNVENYREIGNQFEKILNLVKPIAIWLGVIAGSSILVGVGKLFTKLFSLGTVFSSLGTSITLFASGLISILTSDLSTLDKLKNIVIGLAIALTTAAVAKNMFSTLTWGKALTIGGSVAGAAMLVQSTLNAVPQYATGGFPEDGLFFANSGEMVGKFTNGKTAVANNDQIVTGITQGVYNAMMAYNAQTGGNKLSGDVVLDGQKVGRLVARGSYNEMNRVGLLKAR
jgi:hypothetical protein